MNKLEKWNSIDRVNRFSTFRSEITMAPQVNKNTNREITAFFLQRRH